MKEGTQEHTEQLLRDYLNGHPNFYCGHCLRSDLTIFMIRAKLFEIRVKDFIDRLVVEGTIIEIMYSLDIFQNEPQSAYIVGGRFEGMINNRKDENAKD